MKFMTYRKFFRWNLLLSVWLLLFLVACSGGNSNTKNGQGKNGGMNGSQLTPLQKELQGSWLSECSFEDDLYYTSTYIFSGKSIALITHFYSDEKCTNIVGNEHYKGSYVVAQASQQDLRNIDILVDSVTLTPSSEAFVQQFNGQSYCGFDDWELDKSKDVTGKNCDSETYYAKGTWLFGVVRLAQDPKTKKSQLFFSEFVLSKDRRPKAPSIYPCTKQ